MQNLPIGSSALAQFLAKALPAAADHPGPSNCWAWKVMHYDYAELVGLSAALDVVEQRGQLAALERRVRQEHRKCRALKSQTDFLEYVEEDFRLLDCLTEACAFAWTDKRGLGAPRFDHRRGMPDIHLPPDLWVEAKAVHQSEASRKDWTDSLDENRVLAFISKFQDANEQFKRAGAERRVVFFNLTAVDITHMLRREELLVQYGVVLDQMEAEYPAASAVLCCNYEWWRPIRDPFLPQAQ